MNVNKPRYLKLVGLLAVLGLLVAACSSSSDETASEPDEADDSTETSESDGETETASGPCDGEIDGPVTLRLSAHSSDEPYLEAIDAFNTGPGAELGVEVELVDFGEEAYEDAITAAAASDELPDIIDTDAPFIGNYAWSNIIQPFGNCAADKNLSDFLPSIVNQGSYNGELHALGSFDSGMGLWAKKSALEEVDARIPTTAADAWTVEEFEQVLADLKEDRVSPPLDIKFWYGAGEWRPYGFAPIIQSAGGDILDPTKFDSADGFLNSPESVEAMETFQGWIDNKYVDLGAVDDTNFTEEDVAISWVGHWMYPAYKEALGDDLVLLPLPNFGEGSVSGMGSWAWAMSSTTADPDAAWAFIDFMTSPDQVEAIAAHEGGVPALNTVLDANPSFSEGGDRFMYVVHLRNSPEIARPRPQTPAYLVARNTFSDAFADIVEGADVQETLDAAAEEIDADIEENDGYPAQ